jgi:ABC-2 type transport system permease protein
MKVLLAQLRAEVRMTLTRGESLLLTVGIPMVLLVFFSVVKVIDMDTDEPVDFLAPSTLALAIISMALTGTAIATAFERDYGALKRIGTTPLGRPRLIAAKLGAVLVVQVVQVIALTLVAMLLGWRPEAGGWPQAILAMLLATAGFVGLGLLMAGRLPALVTLAAANGLYLVLLLISGIVVPLSRFPAAFRTIVELLPSTALAQLVRAAFGTGSSVATETSVEKPWIVLLVWACVGFGAAIRWFRWEPS